MSGGAWEYIAAYVNNDYVKPGTSQYTWGEELIKGNSKTKCAEFPYSTVTFFIRGGNHDKNSRAGLFNFNTSIGHDYITYGFRPVLIIL